MVFKSNDENDNWQHHSYCGFSRKLCMRLINCCCCCCCSCCTSKGCHALTLLLLYYPHHLLYLGLALCCLLLLQCHLCPFQFYFLVSYLSFCLAFFSEVSCSVISTSMPSLSAHCFFSLFLSFLSLAYPFHCSLSDVFCLFPVLVIFLGINSSPTLFTIFLSQLFLPITGLILTFVLMFRYLPHPFCLFFVLRL